MMHTNKEGESKLLPQCELPLTGKNCITKVVTDLGYFEIIDGAFHLKELAPGVTVDEVNSQNCREIGSGRRREGDGILV
jgi:3-oxoacid CoA-transferase subunit B